MICSLEAQLAFYRQELSHTSNEKDRRPIYKHNQQLEELRNLQDKLTQEKEQWQREKENEQRELEEKRKKLEEKEVCSEWFCYFGYVYRCMGIL